MRAKIRTPQWVIELLDYVFNSCLELLVCEIECWMILSESACEEQMRNPGNFAQTSSYRLSENTRRSPLSLCEVSPRRAESPERDNFSFRRASLAWARVRSGFLICHCKRSRPCENSSSKRDNSLAQARPFSLSEIPCRSWVLSLFLIKWCCINWIDVIMASLVCDPYAW